MLQQTFSLGTAALRRPAVATASPNNRLLSSRTICSIPESCCFAMNARQRKLSSSLSSNLNLRQFSSGSAGGRSPLPPAPRVLPKSTSKNSSNSSSTNSRVHQTNAGTGNTSEGRANAAVSDLYARTKDRGPVSWPSLFVVAVSAAAAVAYYNIERERRLEKAMGKVVSSESTGDSEGWTPRPDYLAKRKFVATKWGWFPEEDGFGAPGKPAIGGPWSLVDMKGNLVTNRSFEGKWLLLYFGFARCPDICPSEMMKVAQVLDTLKKDQPELAKKLVPLFVSVDPARDSIGALESFGKDFHPDYIFLTGSPVQVQEMAKKYRVYVSKADVSEDGEDYLVDHSIVVYFHNDKGELVDCFTQSMRPSDVVEKVIERMTFKPSY